MAAAYKKATDLSDAFHLNSSFSSQQELIIIPTVISAACFATYII
jgi:hypothetical protein